MIKRILVWIVLCGFMTAGSLLAHHSLAGVYDMKKDMELSGAVDSVKFVNPHGSLTVAVTNPDGSTTNWVLTISAPSSTSAQARGPAPAPAPAQGGGGAGAGGGGAQGGGRGGRGGAPLYTPAAGAKDLKAVLFNWAWYMGMLRSSEEYDLIMSLEYQGTGTMQVDGQPCNVTKYRTSISYQTSGERIQITGTRPNGQSCP